ncbi:hypothetical protein FACS189479_02950 [Spirochaetia bacterium]|nr:hypothetical protein FACS189479_02950 [Spirochaetia bacterium]
MAIEMGKIKSVVSHAVPHALSAYFSLGFLSIGMPAGVPIVLGIDALIVAIRHPKKAKELIKETGQSMRDGIDIFGTAAAEFGKTAAKAAVETVKVVSATIESGYKAAGGDEGMKRAVETLGNAGIEAGKAVNQIVITSGKVVGEVVKDFGKQMQEQREEENETKMLEDVVVNFSRILDDE